MMVDKYQIRKIVGKSSSINERLQNGSILPVLQASQSIIQRRRDRWCQVSSQGNQDLFARRLAWEGVHPNQLSQILASAKFAENYPLPEWAKTLESCIDAAKRITPELLKSIDQLPYIDSHKKIPFESFFIPFMQVAEKKLRVQLNDTITRKYFAPAAWHKLQRQLLHQLSALSSETLQLEFSIYRSQHQSSLSRLLTTQQGSPKDDLYQAFIKQLLLEKLTEFFQEYSVLARLLATTIDFWVVNSAEFLHRLTSDWEQIQTFFQPDTAMGQVCDLHCGLSDPHNQGRTVTAVVFSSGLRIVYKPKNLGLDVAYYQLLDWLNEQGAPLLFKIVNVLNQSSYGWVEYVDREECSYEDEARRFYQRAGMLLGLLYVFNATDCHYENLIAHGEHPVLIDIETLLHPKVKIWEGQENNMQLLANEQFFNSVLRTGLLPQWRVGQDGRSYDDSGLASGVGQQTAYRTLRWRRVNTDVMEKKYDYSVMHADYHVPSLKGENLRVCQYVDDIIWGFQTIYRFLLKQRDKLVNKPGPLYAFALQQPRFVFRHTAVYASTLKKLLNPKYMRNGADRSIELDALSRSFLVVSEEKPPHWPVLYAEKKVMENQDIPCFWVQANSDEFVVDSQHAIASYFVQPGFEAILSNLANLTVADEAQQVGMIRASIDVRFADTQGSVQLQSIDHVVPDTTNLEQVSQTALVERAKEMGTLLQESAIQSANGGTSWIGLEFSSEAQRSLLQPIGLNLHSGSSGIALFLAALAKTTKQERWRSLALSTLQPLQQLLQEPGRGLNILERLTIGGALGLGSIVYAVTRVGTLLDEPTLLADAERVASLITLERINADEKLDVMEGAAGALLGLLSLYEATGNDQILTQAVACGQHLIQSTVESDLGPRAWVTVMDDKLLTGFSHGAAGISYTLLKLYEITEDTVYLEAAEEGIAYESAVFSAEVGNWPDFINSTPEKPAFMNTWCHGAPGIVLARLGGMSILRPPDMLREEMTAALETIKKSDLAGIDNVCCGNFGRIEVLLTAAQELARPDLQTVAYQWTTWALEREKRVGSLHLPYLSAGPNRNVYQLGFFHGIAGVGYTLLRLAYPQHLPTVMLWH